MLTVKATFRSSRTLHATASAASKPGVLRTSELAVGKIFVYIISIKIVGNKKPTVKTETVYALLSILCYHKHIMLVFLGKLEILPVTILVPRNPFLF